jgi:hypothetical protein
MKQVGRFRAPRIAGTAGSALVALTLMSGGALAANLVRGAVIRGASYHGALSGAHAKATISFRVSGAGTEVENLRISSLPIYCGGKGPPGTPKIRFPTAGISARGTFSSAGKDVIASGPLKGSVAATLLVSGTFAAAGKESGTVTTTYSGSARRCGGRSPYSAAAPLNASARSRDGG